MRKALAKREPNAVQHRYTIDELVTQIRGHVYDAKTLIGRANRHRVQAGQKLVEIRTRVEAGEVGEISWWDWFEQSKLGHSRSDAEKLLRLAAADDPDQAADDE